MDLSLLYCVRLDECYFNQIDKIMKGRLYIQSVVEEGSMTGKKHCHFVVQGKINSFRSNFNKYYKMDEYRNSYSIAKLNGESGIAYIIKEGILTNNLFSQEELDNLPKWQVKSQYKKTNTFFQNYINGYPEWRANNIISSSGMEEYWHYFDEYTVDYFVKNTKVNDEFILYRFSNALESKYDQETYKSIMLEKLRKMQTKNI